MNKFKQIVKEEIILNQLMEKKFDIILKKREK